MKRLAIIGAGAWGTALAIVARRAGSSPMLWARDPDVVAAIGEQHENPFYLPGVALDPAVGASGDLEAAVVDADAALLVVPAQFLRAVLERLRRVAPAGLPLLHCAKGIEAGSLAMMSQIGLEVLPASPFAVMSGPSFAVEVARGLPTAVTIASADAALAESFMAALGGSRFRPYLSADPIGARDRRRGQECAGDRLRHRRRARSRRQRPGGADHPRAGRNGAARARFGRRSRNLSRALRPRRSGPDLQRRAVAQLCAGFGARPWAKPCAALAGRRSVVEGVATAAAVAGLAARLAIEMPLSQAVDAVLHHRAPIDATTDRLLRRPYRAE